MVGREIILALIKYSTEDRLKQMQSGKLFFNTLEYFANIDYTNGVGDDYERVYKQTIGKGVTIDLRKEFFNVSVKSIRMPDGNYFSTYMNDEFEANIFCLYAVTDQEDFDVLTKQLPQEMTGFGSHMLIIQDVTEFIKRVKSSLIKRNLNYHISPIQYSDFTKHQGTKTYFEKPLRYSYQKEFRFAFKNNVRQAELIDIGNIEDISMLMSVEKCKSIKIYNKRDDMIDYLVDLHKTLMKNHFDAIVAYNDYLHSDASQDNDGIRLSKLLEEFNIAVESLMTFEQSHGLMGYREKMANIILAHK